MSAAAADHDVPEVTCTGCGRRVRCVRVSDGTVCRPFAWVYPDEERPLDGFCGDCQAERCATAFLGRMQAEVDALAAEHFPDMPAPRVTLGDKLPVLTPSEQEAVDELGRLILGDMEIDEN